MERRIAILICEHFRREVSAVMASEKFEEVVTAFFPARCGRPPLSSEEVAGILRPLGDVERVEIFGASCMPYSENLPEGLRHCRANRLGQCFHLIADPDVVDGCLLAGDYLVSPGWLADWPAGLDRLGLNRETAREMFRETTSRVVLLDTGIGETSDSLLLSFAGYVDRPYEVIRTGLSFLRLLFTKTVLTWRLENERKASAEVVREIRKQSADHAMALDLLGRLAQLSEESEVIEAMLDVYTMLFAPKKIAYLSFNEGVPDRLWVQPPVLETPDTKEMKSRLADFHEESSWTESTNGFLQRIVYRGETQGVIAVEEIAFPEYRDHYLNLAHSILNVCSLPIDSARKYRKIVQTEEMLRKANRALYHQATTDALTGIPNRRSFDEYLEREWRRMVREKAPLSLIMCDIDLFKNYNDLYGHQGGDACLHAVAQAIQSGAVRPGDFVARYGGEEFVVVLPATPAKGALHIAEAIRKAVHRLRLPHGSSQVDNFVTLSLGVSSTLPSAESTPEELLQVADAALYDAKQKGRNRVIPRDIESLSCEV
jgi:diguanylate cyclase (GGDEF)-like protein